MTIPPIIANSALFRFFRIDRDAEGADPAASGSSAPARQAQTRDDIVEISEAARERLDGVRVLGLDDSGEAQSAATQARELLLANEGLTLGLDPAFAG